MGRRGPGAHEVACWRRRNDRLGGAGRFNAAGAGLERIHVERGDRREVVPSGLVDEDERHPGIAERAFCRIAELEAAAPSTDDRGVSLQQNGLAGGKGGPLTELDLNDRPHQGNVNVDRPRDAWEHRVEGDRAG